MKVWTISRGGPTVEVTDTGWISGVDTDFLNEVKELFMQPLDAKGTFPFPGMRGYPARRIDQLQDKGFKVLATSEV